MKIFLLKVFLFILKSTSKTVPTVIVTTAGVGKVNPSKKVYNRLIQKYDKLLKELIRLKEGRLV